MSKWYFAYDAHLSEALQKKLDKAGLLAPLPETKKTGDDVRFVKDYFTPDGYPHLGNDVKVGEVKYPFLLPVIAPWYTGAAIPSVLLDMDSLYRQTACQAALSWLNTLVEEAEPTGPIEKATQTFHGLAFQETIGGNTFTFAFPDTRIDTNSHGPAAVILIADSYWNNEDWEKQGSVPLYARQQAMFQLWCWQQYADKCDDPIDAPKTAFVVRISGNLAIDCTIRTVEYNEREAVTLVNRVCKAKAAEAPTDNYQKRKITPIQTWAEKIDNQAYITEDADLYELVVQYMKARKARKAIEKELDAVVAERDGIAVALASYIPAGELQGYMDLTNGTKCTVTHQPKRARNTTISPDIVRSFFPSYEGCIVASGQHRKTVTIDVL